LCAYLATGIEHGVFVVKVEVECKFENDVSHRDQTRRLNNHPKRNTEQHVVRQESFETIYIL